MQQLVKPSEYAKMHGLSRQSVYAKIKRGTLPSRKIDGRYYVIVSDDLEPDGADAASGGEEIDRVTLIDEFREIIRAKDETIEVLKASIEDLKEANAQITRTLQQEITLLKQAFHEMKEIYRRDYMITHAEVAPASAETPREAEAPLSVEEEAIEAQTLAETPEREAEAARTPAAPETARRDETTEEEEECWIPLGDLIQRKQYNYTKAKQVVKRFKKAYKKGDPRIRKQNGIYYISCYDFYEDILE